MLEPVVRYLPAYTELYRRIRIILKVEKLLRLLCLMMSSIPEFIVTSSQNSVWCKWQEVVNCSHWLTCVVASPSQDDQASVSGADSRHGPASHAGQKTKASY